MACLMAMGFRLVQYAVTLDVTPMTTETIPVIIVGTSGVSMETAVWFWDAFPDALVAVVN